MQLLLQTILSDRQDGDGSFGLDLVGCTLISGCTDEENYNANAKMMVHTDGNDFNVDMSCAGVAFS